MKSPDMPKKCGANCRVAVGWGHNNRNLLQISASSYFDSQLKVAFLPTSPQ